jgi:hypothetical protein
MKKKIADMWVQALRSGEYKQGRTALCRVYEDGSKTYCCLGVLCDLYQKNRAKNKKKKLNEKILPSSDCHNLTCFNDSSGVLPLEVKTWAGMFSPYGEHTFGKCTSLMAMNDSNGNPFTKIADYIEKSYKEL